MIRTTLEEEPVQVVGSAEALKVLVNDREVALETADVTVAGASIDDIIEREGADTGKPLEFRLETSAPNKVASWALTISGVSGEVLHVIRGKGTPQGTVTWEAGQDGREVLKGGETYRYCVEIEYADGSRITTPVRTFGLNRPPSLSVSLTGSAFATGSATLNKKARAILKETSLLLRKHPDETVVIEGHTDAVESGGADMELSRRRSKAAADYLTSAEKISAERIIIRWYGKSRPIASNAVAEGRKLNRRVEIKGEHSGTRKAVVLDQYRQPPFARINGMDTAPDVAGRFSGTIKQGSALEIDMGSASGRSLRTRVRLPSVCIVDPAANGARVPYPAGTLEKHGELKLSYRVAGKTSPGGKITIHGESITVADDSSFSFTVQLTEGDNLYPMQVRDDNGVSREYRLTVTLGRDRTSATPAGTALEAKRSRSA